MKIFKIALTDGEQRDLKESVRSLKDDVRDNKKSNKELENRIDKLEKIIDKLNIGGRVFTQLNTSFNSLERKMERLETVAQDWKNFKSTMDDSVRRQVEKHTKARVNDVSPQSP